MPIADCGMRIIGKKKTFLLPFLISLFLFTGAGLGQEDEDREKFLERQKLLVEKIETLKREQDFLLFQKSLSASDSKYLIIDLSRKTGQLKYKNRVLKDFLFSSHNPVGKILQGTIMLTKKIQGTKEPTCLIFGNSLVLQTKRLPIARTEIPRLLLRKKDFKAIFYALEDGSLVYILP